MSMIQCWYSVGRRSRLRGARPAVTQAQRSSFFAWAVRRATRGRRSVHWLSAGHLGVAEVLGPDGAPAAPTPTSRSPPRWRAVDAEAWPHVLTVRTDEVPDCSLER